MIKIHERDNRGKTNIGWLKSWHTFSFGDFRDPDRMGFRSLRVINEDIVIPGAGFGTHPHNNMEIITYILKGQLQHKDSMGNGSIIKPGEVQKMSAGSGIEHSEFNPSDKEPVHLLQIWIKPDTRDIKPGYEQVTLKPEKLKGGFTQIGGGTAANDNSVTIHQDALLFAAQPKEGAKVSYDFDAGRYGWLQVAGGTISLNGEKLKQGDGAEIADVKRIEIEALADSDILLFDLA